MMLIMKKKIYVAPFAELVDVKTEYFIATSPWTGDEGGDSDQQDAGEYKGSWNDIWGGM